MTNKNIHPYRRANRLRILTAILLGIAGGLQVGTLGGFAIAAVLLFINPLGLAMSGATDPYPGMAGSTKDQIKSFGDNQEETLWEQEIVQSAFQQSPFSDNMVGRVGSGKPIIEHTNTKVVGGQSIVITTVDSLGAPIVQGNAVRVGKEEQIKPGDFELKTSIGFIPVGIDNTGLTQTIVGKQWDRLTQTLLARRLAKQQNDDRLTALKHSATLDNTVFPNGKSLDTLGMGDTFQTSLIVKASGLAKDLGAIPMNAARNPDKASVTPPPIQRYMQFLTDAGARPIKTEANYVHGLSHAAERGKDNPLFTGEYQEWDNNIIYPWTNVRHGGYGSIGSALQPEALLGNALTARTDTTSLPGGATSHTGGGLTGGGSIAAAVITPLRNYFENFSLFSYAPINGLPSTFNNIASGTRYAAIINKTDGKWSFLSYTGNNGNTLTGLTRLGGATAGDYNQQVGDVHWNTGVYTTGPDGNGFQGVSDAAVASGSVIYETNSKGVPLCFGFTLGEMALVEGYGRVPINGGASFKTMVNRKDYEAPYGQAFGRGLEVAWGCAAFKRPDGVTPNYVLQVFARRVDGFPNIL